MEQSEVIKKIEEEANKQFEIIKEVEKKKLYERLDNDKQMSKKVLDLINSHLLFKKVPDEFGKIEKYQLVTYEDFLNDYLKEPKSQWEKGIKFNSPPSLFSGVVKVNGISYYDMRLIINSFEEQINNKINMLRDLSDRLNGAQNDLKDILKNEVNIKKMCEEFKEYQRKIQEEIDVEGDLYDD